MFADGATRFARLCDVALTEKDAGKALGARVPLSGTPHRALAGKCRVLLAHAVNVAVGACRASSRRGGWRMMAVLGLSACDYRRSASSPSCDSPPVGQVEAASAAAPGALARRAVMRLTTPGTLVDEARCSTRPSPTISPVTRSRLGGRLRFALASRFADVRTGELRATDGEGLDALERCLLAVQPAELLLAGGADGRLLDDADSLLSSPSSASRGRLGDVVAPACRAGVPVVASRPSLAIAVPRCNAELCSRLSVDKVESLGCCVRHKVVSAVGALLSFVSGTVEVDGRGRVPLCRAAISSPRVCLNG
jgi:DNA mismatch repair ATPase MutS